ncbi:MAG: BatD family protein [Elusimicrobiales bacterium]|nr:BatD family protein [Elusimicrobiales bacterium]
MKKFSLPLAAVLLALALRADAALSVTAETDRNTVPIDGNLYLTVTVSGDSSSVPEPKLPNMQNFNVYDSGRSQSISIINGRITTSVSFTYILSPRFIGLQRIPAISVFNGKEKAVAPEIQINVTKAGGQQPAPAAAQPAQRPARRQSARPAAGQAQQPGAEQIFIKAEPDRRSAYPGEQINISVKFYTSVPLSSNPQYVPPSFKNLIAEDLPPVRNGETEINGVRYAYSEIKAALFALSPGPAEIKPLTVIAQIPSNEPVDPFDPNFFQNLMAMSGAQGKSKEFTTETITLDIKPLPAGAPADFNGAVGAYSVTASADRSEARTGEAVNFSVTITGNGNLKAVTAPKLPDLPDFKVFDTMSSLDVRKDGDVISGKKTFTYVLVPRAEGRRSIPSIKFSFFDPKTGAYKETRTDPVVLLVEKGAEGGKNVYFNPAATQGPVTASGSDIRYVAELAAAPALPRLAARVNRLPLWVHLPPAGLLLLAFWLARFNRFKSANPLLFRFRRARSEAFRDIEEAEDLIKAGKTNEAVSVLYDSFMDYLSDKCGEKVSALTMRKAADLIRQRFPAAGERAFEEIRELWAALELRHFSPEVSGAEGTSDLAKKYSLLIELLEKELRA